MDPPRIKLCRIAPLPVASVAIILFHFFKAILSNDMEEKILRVNADKNRPKSPISGTSRIFRRGKGTKCRQADWNK